ncbi:glycosyltransferase family 39 protein [Candidatus Woesearchaeota archaeon]|nr:glycosyltransferase family 39 protein [Candidatus Woesearchaeota archaeon]
MNKGFFRSNIAIILIIAAFFASRLYFINPMNIWWDSAVYIGMGKQIFTLGNSGLWEASRPLVFPSMLGLFWKLGAHQVWAYRMIGVFFASGSIFLTYIIAAKLFGRNIGILSALFLALSTTFHLFSTNIMTEIPSLLFALLAVYLYLEGRHFHAGIFFGIAFMTRFLQLFALVPFLALAALSSCREKSPRKILKLALGFAIPIAPYLALNQFLYGNAIEPFLKQLFLTQNTGAIYSQPLAFYLKGLFRENFIYTMAIAGVFATAARKRPENKGMKLAVLSLAPIFAVFFASLQHKEMRFLIIMLPYLCILAALGLVAAIERLESGKARQAALYTVLGVLLIQSGFSIYAAGKGDIGYRNGNRLFQDYMDEAGIRDGIWISSPIYAVNSGRKISELIYYPVFDESKFNVLKSRIHEAKAVVIDSCDIVCEPNAKGCDGYKQELLSILKKELRRDYSNTENECEQLILSR